jgi:oligopeptide/dipeptide ABC transporter ATP-binding protein
MRRLLEVENLGVTFASDYGAVRAVDEVSFDLAEGQILGLVGESGSGKSVSTRALMQLLPNSATIDPRAKILLDARSGMIDIASLGRRSSALHDIRGGEIAMIFQEPMASFAPSHRIGYPIMEAAMLHRDVTKEQARSIAIDLLERVGISEPARRVDQYPFEFSGGMRQRVMIAAALASQPRILVADEPTTALDVTIQAQIIELLRDLRDELGMAIIFITHDLGVIAQIADDVAVMYLGRIVERGSVREIISTPAHPYTVKLLDSIPRFADLHSRLAAIPGDIPNPLARPGGCAFHPRCDRFIPGRCDLELPATTQLATTHDVACHLYVEELSESSDHA